MTIGLKIKGVKIKILNIKKILWSLLNNFAKIMPRILETKTAIIVKIMTIWIELKNSFLKVNL